MLLRKVFISNFLSIKGEIDLDVDTATTILLGANDHGKSNILKALVCLNEDRPITADDLNWDSKAPPHLSFYFSLSQEELDQIVKALPNAPQGRESDKPELAKKDPVEADEIDGYSAVPQEGATPENVARRLDFLRTELQAKAQLRIDRIGVDGPLRIAGLPFLSIPADLLAIVKKLLPRVELFEAGTGALQDSVQASQIKTDEFEFLQGVFYHAGLNPLKMDKLFRQTDVTELRLDDASKALDENLRNIWAQGRDLDLHFELRHRGDRIEFLAKDPAVAKRKTRMSKRSQGVTQFFRISMILHARRRKNPANKYIYLFDEPGVFLHPQGQRDLVQVFEALTIEAQVLYATHSLFMLNQNFPERHRLIVRDKDGTRVDKKPYRANWRLATDALGVYLTANILFNSRVLLVEGDSDPIYLYELFRQLNGIGKTDADTNLLGIFSYSDTSNLRFLLQQFKREEAPCEVVVMADGDSAGRKILSAVKELCKRLGVEQVSLDVDKSIEDYVLNQEHFLAAAEDAIRAALGAEGKEVPVDLAQRVREMWKTREAGKDQSAGRWFKEMSKSLFGSEVSKVSLARAYVFRCRGDEKMKIDAAAVAIGADLCERLIKLLKLPGMRAEHVLTAAIEE